MTSTEAGTLASKASVKQLMLTHLPHYGEHQQLVEEAAARYGGTLTLAESGYVWE